MLEVAIKSHPTHKQIKINSVIGVKYHVRKQVHSLIQPTATILHTQAELLNFHLINSYRKLMSTVNFLLAKFERA